MNNITLIGMPGSGKSTVGVLLAKALGFQFVDVDLLIQQREGALLQELLDNRGVEPFLDAEEAAICSLACAGAVIAPGGSAVCRAGAIGHLRALGRVVYLHVPLPELERRIHNITTRGIAKPRARPWPTCTPPGNPSTGGTPTSPWTWGRGEGWRRR